MNIIDSNQDKEFQELKPGDLFSIHGDTYVKTEPMDLKTENDFCDGISLRTGKFVAMPPTTRVQSHPTAELHLR